MTSLAQLVSSVPAHDPDKALEDMKQFMLDHGYSQELIDEYLDKGYSVHQLYSFTLAGMEPDPAVWERNHMEGKGYV